MAKELRTLKCILRLVEGRFGPRITGWKLRPVLVQGQNFPQSMVSESDRTVTVRLTESTRNHPQQALFQLAHEAIHCLSPAERLDTLWFEEGLANHYALTFFELPEDYRREAEATVPTLFVEPLAAFRSLNPKDTQIKSLRFTHPDFNSWDVNLIKQHFKTTDDLAEKLARRLPTYRPDVGPDRSMPADGLALSPQPDLCASSDHGYGNKVSVVLLAKTRRITPNRGT